MKTGKATLSKKAGKVDKIEDSGFGGFNVFIDGQKHVTGRGLDLKVKKGSEVKKGDPLSMGSIIPQELLELKNMKEVQNYMTDELKSAYESEGINIDRKTFESVVRSITNRTQVINDIDELPFAPGDTMSLSEAENYNKNRGDKAKLIHKPYLAGVNVIPTKSQDWMAQMGAHHIVDAVTKGASQGWFSDTKDYHPIPAFAAGANFGEGKEGRY
jgi:DNA-directed RNA polymerase subunit beta'